MGSQFTYSAFSLLECNGCDLIFLGQELTAQDFARMYEQSFQFNGGVYRQEEAIAAAKDFYSGCYWRLLQEIGVDAAEARLLEAGAGRAWMCMVACDAGTKLTVAQDVSAECAAECPWVSHYVTGDISDARVARHAPYDVISMTHVIEHVPDPVDFMRRLKGLMSLNGRMFITAPHRPPDWSAASSAEEWSRWTYHHVPGHLQYFSEAALRKSAEVAGLRMMRWALHEEGQAFEAVLSHNA